MDGDRNPTHWIILSASKIVIKHTNEEQGGDLLNLQFESTTGPWHKPWTQGISDHVSRNNRILKDQVGKGISFVSGQSKVEIRQTVTAYDFNK